MCTFKLLLEAQNLSFPVYNFLGQQIEPVLHFLRVPALLLGLALVVDLLPLFKGELHELLVGCINFGLRMAMLNYLFKFYSLYWESRLSNPFSLL